MNTALKKYKSDLQQELDHILGWWMKYAVDKTHGGFYGKINNQNTVFPTAEKGLVLNARILWTFAAAYNQTRNSNYLQTAERAYHYITAHFYDKAYGGLYWSVDHQGNPLNRRKQIYGQAFGIYGLSEYYLATKDQAVLDIATELFHNIETYSFDALRNGYTEAFSEEWKEMDDLRLSDKDANEKKTMNTHLHIMEAYTNLFRCWPDERLSARISNLVHIFLQYIINPGTFHLDLFFDEDWNIKGNTVSFGHDIEASWLLLEAAEVTGDSLLTEQVRSVSVRMAEAAAEGLDDDGGLRSERTGSNWNNEKHWWPQAEAIVGFLNAWQLTGREKYLQSSLASYAFICWYIRDHHYGEWRWGIGPDNTVMDGEDKCGFWKGPYHNGRSCIEGIKRIERMLSTPGN